MAADIRIKYPATDTVAVAITLASLASDTNLLAGRESDVVTNSNNDTDHILSGQIMPGTTPGANTKIDVYVYTDLTVISGTSAYPDVLDGTDSNETLTNSGIRINGLILAKSIAVIATTSNVGYPIPKTSIKKLFGYMPKKWGVFVVQNTGAALNSTSGNHFLHYERIQGQTV